MSLGGGFLEYRPEGRRPTVSRLKPIYEVHILVILLLARAALKSVAEEELERGQEERTPEHCGIQFEEQGVKDLHDNHK
jgi:hypothetical protein